MADQMSVSGPITVQPDSAARVAYDLMIQISNWENADESKKRTRDYWLTLFHQCALANRSNSLESILKHR